MGSETHAASVHAGNITVLCVWAPLDHQGTRKKNIHIYLFLPVFNELTRSGTKTHCKWSFIAEVAELLRQ